MSEIPTGPASKIRQEPTTSDLEREVAQLKDELARERLVHEAEALRRQIEELRRRPIWTPLNIRWDDRFRPQCAVLHGPEGCPGYP